MYHFFVILCVSSYSSYSKLLFFFFKQKTAYEMRISDWSSDVCSSDLGLRKRTHKSAFYPSYRRRRNSAFPTTGVSPGDRKSVVSGKSVSVRVAIGDRRIIKITTSISDDL